MKADHGRTLAHSSFSAGDEESRLRLEQRDTRQGCRVTGLQGCRRYGY